MSQDATLNDEENVNGFQYNQKTIMLENGKIQVVDSGRVVEQITVDTFARKPSAAFEILKRKIK